MSENHSNYNFSEVESSLSRYHQAKGDWNDKKSKEIDEKYYSNIQLACSKLIELAKGIEAKVNEISDKLDQI